MQNSYYDNLSSLRWERSTGLAPAAQHSFGAHLSSSSFFFIMSLLQAGMEARRAASSSACMLTQGWRETWEETAARARQ